MTAINRSISRKATADAAMIVHNDIRILPLSAELQVRAAVTDKLSVKCRPVIHVKADRFAIGGEIQVLAHAAAQVHPQSLPLWRANIGQAGQVRSTVHPAASRSGLE